MTSQQHHKNIEQTLKGRFRDLRQNSQTLYRRHLVCHFPQLIFSHFF